MRQWSSDFGTEQIGFELSLSHLTFEWCWASDLTSLCLFPQKFVVRIIGSHAYDGQTCEMVLRLCQSYQQTGKIYFIPFEVVNAYESSVIKTSFPWNHMQLSKGSITVVGVWD